MHKYSQVHREFSDSYNKHYSLQRNQKKDDVSTGWIIALMIGCAAVAISIVVAI